MKVSVGQYSDKGRKTSNQDFHGVAIPKEPQLGAKGIAVALADGISSSDVSHIASEFAVSGFLDDYYCTSDAWSVKTAGERVLTAANAWLYSQTRQGQSRYDKDRGYVCTLSAMVIKSSTAHLFHVGDARIYRLRGATLEQLTNDHRIPVSEERSYLGRALGVHAQLEIDYLNLQVEAGDMFVFATDGVHEFVPPESMVEKIGASLDHLDAAAKAIADEAYARGSGDNLTVQLLRVDQLPLHASGELVQQLSDLCLPPLLDARMEFDGYKIIKEVHGSSRSHVYLALDSETNARVILKAPSIDLGGDPVYLERFLMEEWVARRINSPYVLKPCAATRKRQFLYIVSEYIEGQSLAQWMVDNPKPALETVRGIVEQIAKGLRAFHRLDMLHQDLRPENIMIDTTGTVKIIDFGSTRVAGLVEAGPLAGHEAILGTPQYTAPEYFLGEIGSPRSDLFSLGVITYQMLTGRLPYGAQVAKTRTRSAQANLIYDSVLDEHREIPAWIDMVLKKALHPDPAKRYEELSEFVQDLRQPNKAFLSKTRAPLIERSPLKFWKGVSFILALIVVALLFALHQASLAKPALAPVVSAALHFKG
ncbi:MAG: bifunctional protein-serine/threonine kinase/phosphatase [Pseudomonadota bacterium]